MSQTKAANKATRMKGNRNRRKVRRLHDSGKSTKEIAEKTGLSVRSVQRYKRQVADQRRDNPRRSITRKGARAKAFDEAKAEARKLHGDKAYVKETWSAKDGGWKYSSYTK